ncbi:spore coat protein [Aquibacillus rhizosphaerae]|uniref:Spore coat protein n=1 Tax=Aquibacillus rhizosphaerae TaxID=3051431 RepID=A0ABT7L6U5_9BACI|nr:spore coat protein [Aquibacillus sp. LR5S19]MDL4841129.1 spore coat protein [Aquibacillus sp. LR5S19]
METKQLAWHESLELHELTAFQSIGLIKLKNALPMIKKKELKVLYQQAISEMEASLKELLHFYQSVPTQRSDDQNTEERNNMKETLYEGDLLLLAKTAVRNYSIAITETATPTLKEVLIKQLMKLIKLHDSIFQYMNKSGDYPAYDLNKLFKNDITLANKALKL